MYFQPFFFSFAGENFWTMWNRFPMRTSPKTTLTSFFAWRLRLPHRRNRYQKILNHPTIFTCFTFAANHWKRNTVPPSPIDYWNICVLYCHPTWKIWKAGIIRKFSSTWTKSGIKKSGSFTKMAKIVKTWGNFKHVERLLCEFLST